MATIETDGLVAAIAATPATSAVMLDLDGTLAPIIEHPGDVAIPAEIRVLLPVLRDRYGLVAFISGRARDDLRGIVALDGVAYSGNHGIEVQLDDGRILPTGVSHGALETLKTFARHWSGQGLDTLGVWMEHKGGTLTFHYRTAPDQRAARRHLEQSVVPAARAVDLVAAMGRMSIEIHPSESVHKGSAADTLLDARPAIRRAISLGDDRTDADVWRALRARVVDGRLDLAVGVGVISDESPAAVRAESDIQVPGVEGTLALLRVLAGHQAP